MKNVLLVVILFTAVIFGGATLGKDAAQTLSQQPPATSNPVSHLMPVVTPTPTPTVGSPTTILIPAIGVNATVEDVGVDSLNRMDVPKHGQDVGWYDLGVKPGATGNAVIDGHLDLVTGAPAVFWNLAKLTLGDEIIVTDDNNLEHRFKVTDIESYPYDQFPSQTVFGQSSRANLNLITCHGTWDASNKNYSERTVVYSQLE